jgi:hypothetical protein
LSQCLEDAFESQLAWSTSEGILNYGGKSVVFHTIDRELLLLCDGATRKEMDLAIIYPVRETSLLVPIAVETLYALMSYNQRKSILLITRKFDVREHYKDLRANDMHIHEDVFRLCIIKRDGSFRRMRQRSGYRPGGNDRFFLTTSVNYLPNDEISKDINTVIIDLSSGVSNEELEILKTWSYSKGVKNTIYMETDPYSAHIDFIKKNGISLWGWDNESLKNEFEEDIQSVESDATKYDNPFSCSFYSISNLIRGVSKTVIEERDDEIDQLMMDALKLYYTLKKEAQKTGDIGIRNATYCFLSVLFSFERMTAPLKYVESEREISYFCRTIDELIESLENYTDAIYKKDELLGSLFSKTDTICRKLYGKFNDGLGFKPQKIAELIDEAIKQKKKTLVICYSDTYMRALISYLEDKYEMSEDYLKQNGIEFSSLRNCENGNYDQCIFFGHLPRKFRYLIRITSSKEAIFLVYPAERALLMHQLKADRSYFGTLYPNHNKSSIIEKITGVRVADKQELQRETEDSVILLSNQEIEARHESISAEFQPIFHSVTNDEEFTAEFYDEQSDFGIESESHMSGENIVNEDCVKVSFQDGKRIVLRESKIVPVYIDFKSRIAYKKASALKSNDVLVVTNKGVKNDLTSTIIEMVDSHPSMKKINIMVKSWVYYLRKGMKKSGDDVDSLLSKLIEKGSKITTDSTVYFWGKGYVIGPRNPEDIKRIGEIYNFKFLIENYKEIYAAVRRLRGIHHSLLRRLSSAIPQAGVMSISAEDKNEIVDEELDLHLEDFLNIISLHRISKVESGIKAEVTKQDKIIE